MLSDSGFHGLGPKRVGGYVAPKTATAQLHIFAQPPLLSDRYRIVCGELLISSLFGLCVNLKRMSSLSPHS